MGGNLQFKPGTWAYLFPDAWQGNTLPGLRCPLQPHVGNLNARIDRPPEAPPVAWEAIPHPTFYISAALTPGLTRTEAPTSRRFFRIDHVRHPSKKFVLFEACVWCGNSATASKDRATSGTTSDIPFAYSAADGAAGRTDWDIVRRAHALQATASSPPSLWQTPGGVEGWDLP